MIFFKNLKANPKYLKQIFSEQLIELFKEKQKLNRIEDNLLNEENLIHNIFSGY